MPRPGAEIFKLVVEKILAKVTADAYDAITKSSSEALQVVAQIEATDSLIEADGKLQDIVGLVREAKFNIFWESVWKFDIFFF